MNLQCLQNVAESNEDTEANFEDKKDKIKEGTNVKETEDCPNAIKTQNKARNENHAFTST